MADPIRNPMVLYSLQEVHRSSISIAVTRILTPWVDPAVTYGRQELSELAAVSDDVLSFWIKRKLLVPEDAAAGKGVHHRFHYSQVSVAVVLKTVREHFGANIGTLKSLADTLQLGCKMFRKTKAPVTAWRSAVSLADRLARFRRGESLEVMYFDDDADAVVRKPAASEADIIQECLGRSDRVPGGVIIRLAEQIGPGHERELDIAQQLLGTVLDPRYGGGYWLLANNGGEWTIFADTDDATLDRSALPPAMFLPIGKLMREPWAIPSTAMLRALDIGLRLEAVAADHGLNVSVAVKDEDGAATFTGPDSNDPRLDALIQRLSAPEHWLEKAGLVPLENKHGELYWTLAHQLEREPK